MPWRDDFLPARMRRVAVVAPVSRTRRVLVEVADLGVFEPDPPPQTAPGPIATLATRSIPTDVPLDGLLSVEPVDIEQLAGNEQFDLLLGESQLEQRVAASLPVGNSSVLPGWMLGSEVEPARAAIAAHGGSLVELPDRRDLVPPTAHGGTAVSGAFRPLVTTYGTVPYRDIDPTWFATIAYMVMFGMMFGDVGHGLTIVAVGLIARFGPFERLQRLRRVTPFLIGAGTAATVFGLLYGEAFGPTGLVPTLWLRPLDEPERLLIVGLVVGGALLAITMLVATVNRWREDGPKLAVYDASGLAGALLLMGLAGFVIGTSTSTPWLRNLGLAVAVVGAILTFIGLIASSSAGPSGVAEAIVEMFDTLLRLGSNAVSFTRLAAFGLTHAVISEVVWDGTRNLWDRSNALGVVAAVALFSLGNAAAFTLGALVGAIQALRLEYYELFSRLFVGTGRPFEPWHVPARRAADTGTTPRVTDPLDGHRADQRPDQRPDQQVDRRVDQRLESS